MSMQREALQRAALRYHAQVDNVLPYLETRGLNDRSTIDDYLLGVVVDPIPGHESYVGRLVVPYLTPSAVVNMRFRCLRDHDCKESNCAKYLGPSQKVNLYNVAALRAADSTLYVTEGELDAISATVVGFPAVGVPGVQAWNMKHPRDEDEAKRSKRHWLRLFEDYESVVVLADGDDPGKNFAEKVLNDVENARAVYMPKNSDVNSVLMERGVDEFRSLLQV
ncbi:toprim domain-containing protein [Jiangella anatolica]|uniref:Uncharacterized protein n=1 Tax=Jiangella anatolica TaxID=2670374 RepID=A0A2W2B7J3_9ACTN|nr:toprim domain-containing protein [Jiangella anatolica]PZF83225.1 hypothetical protein C1I92_13185 [Jiangella anatolica]